MANKPKKTAAEIKAERFKAQVLQFSAAYVSNGRNATRAYQVLFPTCGDASAATKGGQWLRKVEVQDEIQKLTAAAFKREHMSAEEALAIVARRARLDIATFYWKPGELDRDGNTTTVGHRKPLRELTEAQQQCIVGFKSGQWGTDMLFADADKNMNFVLKHHKLLTDKVDLNVTLPLDKLLEQSYGGEETQA